MGVLAPLMALIVGLTLIASVSDYFVSSRKTTKQNQMAITKMDAAREMGPIVRNAFDTYRRQSICPTPGTKLFNTNPQNVPLCWPTRNNGCLDIMGKDVCLASGFIVASAPSTPSLLWALNIQRAHAARTVPLAAINPRTSVAPTGGVWVGMPVPGNSEAVTTFSPNCTGNTVCITLAFCVGDSQMNGCSSNSPNYVSQTYAIWNFEI